MSILNVDKIQPIGSGSTVTVNATDTILTNAQAGVITATRFDGIISATTDDWITHQSDSNTRMGFPAVDTFSVETAGSERLRITSTGLLSIGNNSNLDSQLTVTQAQGDCVRLRSNATNNTFKYGIIKQEPYNNNALGVQIIGGKSDSGYSEVDIGGGIDGGYATTQIDFWTAANTTTATGTRRLRIDSSGNVLIGTTTAGFAAYGDALTIEHSNHVGLTLRTATNKDAAIYFADSSSGGGRYAGAINYGHSSNYMNFTVNESEKLRITSDGVIQTSGTTKIKPNSVGIGTTSITNTGVGTAYGEMMYNTTTNNIQVYTTTTGWYNVSDLQGYYKTAAAASSDGMNHYWGGSGSTSIISGLTPSGSPDGSPGAPGVNLTAQSYYGDYPYFDFASGNNELGYMFLKSGTKWGAGPFSICFWVDIQGVTLESESTFVQLGSHSGVRSMYTVSGDADRKLKAITIGDDTGVSSDAQMIGNTWQHVAVTYNTSRVTKYYINGSLVRSFTHNSALDVGTSSQYIYLGYGYWNSSAGNKASISHMSDIGIWDAKELNATEIKNIYNAKRIIRGY